MSLRFIGILGSFVLGASLISGSITRAALDAAYKLSPDANLAYLIAHESFSSTEGSYDVRRAEFYFHETLKQDPAHPYAYHELARIAFLKGDFQTARILITYQIDHISPLPQSYYIRGLIEGYQGDYTDAARDYEHYLAADPNTWAAINDYAWVLLKNHEPQKAAEALARGLALFPTNAWLNNSAAIALYEIGDFGGARVHAEVASAAAALLTTNDWLTAYPGNDPRLAEKGLSALKASIASNMHTINSMLHSDGKDSIQ